MSKPSSFSRPASSLSSAATTTAEDNDDDNLSPKKAMDSSKSSDLKQSIGSKKLSLSSRNRPQGKAPPPPLPPMTSSVQLEENDIDKSKQIENNENKSKQIENNNDNKSKETKNNNDNNLKQIENNNDDSMQSDVDKSKETEKNNDSQSDVDETKRENNNDSQSDVDKSQQEVKAKLRRRERIVRELLSTEDSFLESVAILCDEYHLPLRSATPSILTERECHIVFDAVEWLRDVNGKFLSRLSERVRVWSDAACVGDVLLRLVDQLDVFLQFVATYDAAAAIVERNLASNREFAALCTRVQHAPRSRSLDLRAHLMTPIQRIPRYVLLFADLADNTPVSHPDAANVNAAKDDIKAFAQTMNERKRERDNDEANRQLAARIDGLGVRIAKSGRYLIHQGEVLLVYCLVFCYYLETFFLERDREKFYGLL